MAAKISCFIIFGIITVVNGKPAADDTEVYVRDEFELQKILRLLANQGKFNIALRHHEDGLKNHHEDTARISSDGKHRDNYNKKENEYVTPYYDSIDEAYNDNVFQSNGHKVQHTSNANDGLGHLHETFDWKDMTVLENLKFLNGQVNIERSNVGDSNELQDDGYYDYISGIENGKKNGERRNKPEILAHNEDNNNVYLPKWMLYEISKPNVKQTAIVKLMKTYLPRSKQQKERIRKRLEQEARDKRNKAKHG
ncbi:unnamed protein product [Spodoptera littoralis]|uniref:Uncharacterized protein n=1 Tax=Spodoptera littoralis TaxID=7109 RepID=A0A9P0N5R4_SPOLI|nr:unnamed protein product [Spodoptera littoralis]CAH1640875.1 unnamed protein product [Spodoptera littoralis]